MNTTLKTSNFFEDLNVSNTTGNIEIYKNGILWQLFLVDGKLEFANHSLHSGDKLKHFLKKIDHSNADKFDLLKNNKAHIKHQISHLEKKGFITNIQKYLLQQKISEDAIESLYWLSKNHEENLISPQLKPLKWAENEVVNTENLIDIELLINNIKSRWLSWKKLSPIITSPHQIPVCKNSSILDKYEVSGFLSGKVLKQLARFMNELSIRELALLIKQDELKLAQLLLPYIKQGIIQLKPPKSPLNLLPQIPINNVSNSLPEIPPIKVKKPVVNEKKYSIVCIDDSPAMLEIISSYLDTNKYHLTTISEPMKSLSFLFKSNPDLIIMDISMPGINGNRLCKILKSSPVFKSIPIILISGENNIEEDILESTGARDFLAKPFEKTALINLIHKYC
ncbi:response regulator [Geminocystis sp. GBBB08]|uniref:response regulator n=1 Tax=Geminocystis sp. GBBB08 TaxID=2604140 RepID=UPI0027E3A0AE|nr:response regulator [Geminocystis sp. GBBB08]MBL1210578.1 response regulator [Geminocystis sp. GBBB08]